MHVRNLYMLVFIYAYMQMHASRGLYKCNYTVNVIAMLYTVAGGSRRRYRKLGYHGRKSRNVSVLCAVLSPIRIAQLVGKTAAYFIF